mmetsp:Transcript_101295/g.290635  ORF Transcript_101295/g.290635 Transcript_101295/m.290635 type:complete len:224 (-) Transcript_101295:896-1567(-)
MDHAHGQRRTEGSELLVVLCNVVAEEEVQVREFVEACQRRGVARHPARAPAPTQIETCEARELGQRLDVARDVRGGAGEDEDGEAEHWAEGLEVAAERADSGQVAHSHAEVFPSIFGDDERASGGKCHRPLAALGPQRADACDHRTAELTAHPAAALQAEGREVGQLGQLAQVAFDPVAVGEVEVREPRQCLEQVPEEACEPKTVRDVDPFQQRQLGQHAKVA